MARTDTLIRFTVGKAGELYRRDREHESLLDYAISEATGIAIHEDEYLEDAELLLSDAGDLILVGMVNPA